MHHEFIGDNVLDYDLMYYMGLILYDINEGIHP